MKRAFKFRDPLYLKVIRNIASHDGDMKMHFVVCSISNQLIIYVRLFNILELKENEQAFYCISLIIYYQLFLIFLYLCSL